MKKQILRSMTLAAALTVATGVCAQEAAYYSTDFKAASPGVIGFATIDANADGTTWQTQTSTLDFRNMDGSSITAVKKTPATIASGTHDDWLISPSIYFEAGKTYETTFTMCKFLYAAVEDAFEIKMGLEKDAESMTLTVLPLEDGDLLATGGNSLWNKKVTITVDKTGDYYVGIHAVGKAGQKFGIAEMVIEKGIEMITPVAVADLTLTPSPTAQKTVTVEFTAPVKAKDGSDLTALDKIEIKRNGELVTTLSPVTPGQKLSYEDRVAVSGLYTYAVQAFTTAGGGDAASATTFVGLNTPASTTDVTAANTGARSATIAWTAPTLDKDGYPIPAEVITYDVYRKPIYENDNVKVASKLSELTFADVLPDTVAADTVCFFTYSVVARTAEGQAAAAAARPIPMGRPYSTPFSESFRNGRSRSIYTSTPLKGNNYWQVTTNFEDVSASDADNGMVFLSGMIGGAASFATGLFDLGDMPSPSLSYYTYNITNCDPADHELEVTVIATDGTTKSFGKYVPAMGWNKVILPLDDFAGKTIRVTFDGYRNNNTELFIDNIAISNIYRHDLKLTALNVPAKVRSSEPFDVIADVLNFGFETAAAYTVELYCNSTLADTYNGTDLAVGAYDHVKFTRTHGILDGESATYSAKVIFDGDQDADNNASEEVTTIIRVNSYPTVTDLTGSSANGVVTLTWSEPDTDKAQPYETLETFDSYDSWATKNVGEWIFADCDSAVIAGFTEQEMPGIAAYSTQSWWVFDGSHSDFNNGSFETLSGYKFLAAMVSGIKGEGPVQNDDWAISPELYGGPQTITINARSYDIAEQSLETFEVLYSTGSTDPKDFVSLKTFTEIPSQYNAYEVDLPDGARRFAIRYISYNKLVIMVDDVTYIPAGDPAAFTINGYNVYRDGKLLNAEPIEENEFVDTEAGAENHLYQVSVLYSAGESQLGNEYFSKTTGIESVTVSDGPAVYYNLQGVRIDRPEAGKTYIRVAAGKTQKIIVR